MILAKIYLNAQVYINANKYQECITKCQEIINGGYTLNSNYLEIILKLIITTSNELIFGIESSGEATQNFGQLHLYCETSWFTRGKWSSIWVGGFWWSIVKKAICTKEFDGNQFNTDTRKISFHFKVLKLQMF
jgi:hypothetical protein